MKVTTTDDYCVVVSGVIYPTRVGDLGFMQVSDSMVASAAEAEAEYRRRCEAIAREVREQYPHLKAEVVCTTEVTCSHCGIAWEEFTAEHAAQFPDWDDPIGLPQCCDEAQAEWRAAQAAAPTTTETTEES